MILERQSVLQNAREYRRGKRVGRWWAGQRGQSLVEMAIMTPLLLLMFIGVIEVGWALRGYLVLINVDREAARFAARGYQDFKQPDIEDVGYEFVLDHAMASLAGQLPLDFTSENPNATLIITHLEIDTGYPCDNNLEGNPPCNDTCSNPPCDCSALDKREPAYPGDDLIILPPPVGSDPYSDPTVAISNTFRAEYGIGSPIHTTRVEDDLWETLREQNDEINCTLLAKDEAISPSPNSVIIVEIFYDQPQLLGVPIVSNQFTNPIPLYAHTMMRIPGIRQPK